MPHHSRHHHYHLTRLNEIKRLYWAHTIKTLASQMAMIFVPIYLYTLEYSATAIMTYFLGFGFFWAILQYPVLLFSNRIGFNRAMGLSMVVQALHLLMVSTISVYHWPLWSVAFIWALLVALYWPSFRACFARSLLHKRVGPSVGVSVALTLLAYGIAPAVGGAIATQFGIIVLYILAILFFLAASIPLFGSKEIIKQEPFDLRTIKWRRIRKDLAANMGSEIDDSVGAILWPLFIFLLIPTYVGVGILSSVSVIASILIALYVGQRATKKGIRWYLNKGTTTISLMNAGRLFAQSAGHIAGVNFINGLGRALLSTPYDSRYYRNAEREPLLPYIYAMMVICAVGDVLLFGTLLIVSLFAPIEIVLAAGLAIAIPAAYAIRLMRT